MKRDFELVIENQLKKRAKYGENIKKIREEADSKYGASIQAINKCIKKLEEARDVCEEQKSIYKQTLMHELGEHPDLEFLETLQEIMKNGPLFYPNDDSFVKEIRAIQEGDGEHIEGLDTTEEAFIYDFVKQCVMVEEKIAIFRMYGRVKGYKGDETTFKPDRNELPELVEGTGKPSDESDWDKYYRQPNAEEIDWPDLKSTVATAKIRQPCTLITITPVE